MSSLVLAKRHTTNVVLAYFRMDMSCAMHVRLLTASYDISNMLVSLCYSSNDNSYERAPSKRHVALTFEFTLVSSNGRG